MSLFDAVIVAGNEWKRLVMTCFSWAAHVSRKSTDFPTVGSDLKAQMLQMHLACPCDKSIVRPALPQMVIRFDGVIL